MVNRAKEISKKDGKQYLQNIFHGVEKELQLDLKKEITESTHDATLGENCEQHWISLLRNYLPVRYGVAKAFVVDSNGKTSDAIDVVIFDPLYIPALYGHNRVQYLPREAVYAVFETKPTVNKQYLAYAGDKAKSVQELHCTSAPIVNAGRNVPPREVFPVLTGLLALNTSWVDNLQGDAFKKNLPTKTQNKLDFIITAESGFYDGQDRNNPIIADGEGSLMRGLFRLLQALQQLGTVPCIDWSVYEKNTM